MLELRPNGEMCDRDLPPDSPDARVCSYECTYCARCVETVLHDVCPTCGGNFAPRPIRPVRAWRVGRQLGLGHDPAATAHRHSPHSREDIAAHTTRIRDIAPAARRHAPRPRPRIASRPPGPNGPRATSGGKRTGPARSAIGRP